MTDEEREKQRKYDREYYRNMLPFQKEKRKEAARHEQYQEQKLDASLTKAASEAYYQLPPSKRDILRRIEQLMRTVCVVNL